MDLPTCPACGQSVLDDEAENCPFCGASMSGKPTATKAPAAPKAAAPRPAAPAAPARPAAKPAAAKPAAAKNDDPFAIKADVSRGAVRLSPKPIKGATHPIVCPMCETVGYGPRQAAGKEVRCANPKCLVPVFTAPPLAPEPVAEPESRPLPLGMMAVIAVAVVGVVGALFWLFVLRNPNPAGPQPIAQQPAPGEGGPKPLPLEAPKTETPDLNAQAAAAEPTAAEVRPKVLEGMVRATRDVDPTHLHKPVLVRSTAEAFALAGQNDGLRDQLGRLNEVPYYRIVPLTLAAARQSAAGDDAAARKLVDEAFQYGGSIPSTGHDPWDASTSLAAALAAVGRDAEARGLLRKADSEQETRLAQLWADLLIVRAVGTFHLDQYLESPPVVPWSRPQPAAVAALLAARGQWDQASQWSAHLTDADGQIEATCAWAQIAADTPNGPLATIETAMKDLPPAGAARVAARVAERLAARGDATADQWLEKAKTLLAAVPTAEPMTLGGIGDVWQSQRPQTDTGRRAAIAAAELARAQARRGSAGPAWESLQTALQFARATGPSLPAIQQFADQLGTSETTVRGQLVDLLDLKSEDAIRRTLRDYRRKVDDLRAAAEERLRLEARLLATATDPALVKQAAEEALSRAQATDVNEQEPFGQTAVPLILADRLGGPENRSLADDLRQLNAGTDPIPERTTYELSQSVEIEVAAGRLDEAAAALQRSKADQSASQRIALRTANRLVAQDRWPDARRFVERFSDQSFQENALELIAAQTVAGGKLGPVWEAFQEPILRPDQRIALGRGLVAGLQARPAAASR